MKAIVAALVLCLSLAAAVPARAGMKEGMAAYRSGDYQTAAKELLPLARKGNSQAQMLVGRMALEGQGVPRSPENAARFFRAAAAAGLPKAQSLLAGLYYRGQGVEQDYGEAAKWARRAAQGGEVESQYLLGVMNAKGEGMPRNLREAQRWLNMAAMSGNSKAQKALDRLHQERAKAGVEGGNPQQPASQRQLAPRPEGQGSRKQSFRSQQQVPRSPRQDRRPSQSPSTEEQTATTTAVRNRETEKAQEAPQTAALAPDIFFGDYHALVIGNNDYRELPKLGTARNDARMIGRILEKEYGFKVTTLLDADRYAIVTALNDMRQTLTDEDNLLIYYAGHGVLDEDADEGYWLPVDASTDNPANWFSNATLTSTLKAIQAKHVMVIADSCFSGKLTRDAHVDIRTPDYLERLSLKRARTALTSGGLEPVADAGGKGDHSIFAAALLEALRENDGIMEGTELFAAIRRPVMLASDQTPEYADIRKAGHDGGDFLFVRKK